MFELNGPDLNSRCLNRDADRHCLVGASRTVYLVV